MTTDPAAPDDVATADASTAASAADAERRLHPMSWLFVLLAQLKQFIVPLVALLVFGQRADNNGMHELWPLVGVGVLALLSVWQYFTYRYGVLGDRLVVRSGVLHRSLRVIPFARIHNVAVQQSLLHRIFNVAEVRLESAGGQKPEAEMRVLRLDDALALETLVRRRGAGSASAAQVVDAPDVLLELPPGEVIRLGLISNRGLIVVGAAFAGLSQFSPRLLPNLFERWGEALFGYADAQAFSVGEYALAGTSLVVALVLLLRALSVALALLQYFGFRLSEQGRRLTVERGLLARWRTSASRRRIQAWTLREGVLHRLFKRRGLEVDTAVAEQPDQQRSLREVAPIATPERCDGLIEHLLPQGGWPTLEWRTLPPAAWWRLFLPGAWLPPLLAAVLAWRFGACALLVLLWLPWSAFKARQHARRIAYALGDELVAVREGWWSRHWRFAELDKLQSLDLVRSPVDRRCGTATLWMDTAGAGALAPPLRIRFLPDADAEALYRRLSTELARRRLRW